MKRNAFDDQNDRRVADDFLDGHLPCRWCQATTPKADLATYGARCRRCYEAYCAEANPRNRVAVGPMTLAEKQAVIRSIANIGKGGVRGPKDWAHRLCSREQAGERLSPAQRKAWREALNRPEKSPADDRAAA
jgi:uncharacterized membrane protein